MGTQRIATSGNARVKWRFQTLVLIGDDSSVALVGSVTIAEEAAHALRPIGHRAAAALVVALLVEIFVD